MATISLTVFKAKALKDGRHKIRIAIRHHHETCYIVTPYIIDNIKQFKNGNITGIPDACQINTKLRKLLNYYQDIIDESEGVGAMTCVQLKNFLLNKRENGNGSNTFQQVSSEYIKTLDEDGRHEYAILLERNCRYFTAFGHGDMMLSTISPSTIDNYSRFLRNKGLSETSVGMHMSRTRTIINRAKKMQLVSYSLDPFIYYHIQQSQERELDISVNELRQLINLEVRGKPLETAKDTFLLSYYLGGINLIDLLEINFKDETKIDYIREKTRNTKHGEKKISVSIQPEALEIINKHLGADGKLNFGYDFTYKNFSRYNTRNIKKLGEMIGVDYLCYYSARKSFVQHGFELGVPLEVLEYIIGHTMKRNRPIFNYVRIMRKHADIAIRKILDNLESKEGDS